MIARRLFIPMLTAAVAGCRRKPSAPIPSLSEDSPWLLTPGALPPDWNRLDPWQEALTRDEFSRVLEGVTTDGTAWFRYIEISEDRARIRISTPRPGAARYELRFAAVPDVSRRTRTWRRADELPALHDAVRPLTDIHIALDPGHIGGVWAQMEQRWYQKDGAPPVKEGELTLKTARILAPMLEALGARVSFVRNRPVPVTDIRPEALGEEARASLLQQGRTNLSEDEITKESERLFYRAHEVRARGRLVNEVFKPDLVICLHYNAESWGGDAMHPTFSSANHLHVLAHGCIGAGEFELDDQRLEGLLRLVQRIPETEMDLCREVATAMAKATALPPYTYFGSNARPVEGAPYVWTRNLLANRVYTCPVVFTEPYVMNNAQVLQRFLAGDYDEDSMVAGVKRISIFREYAAGVTEGLRSYFARHRS